MLLERADLGGSGEDSGMPVSNMAAGTVGSAVELSTKVLK